MAQQINDFHPIYSDKVKITGWTTVHESYPFDNSKKNEAHYKSLGTTTNFFIPQTTAKEAMETGSKRLTTYEARRRSVINFTSFIEVDKIISGDAAAGNVLKKFDKLHDVYTKPVSTYQRDYISTGKLQERFCIDKDLPHPFFNRFPKNDFIQIAKDAPGKFMDSHLYDTLPVRKCINYLRQIRDSSNVF